MIDLHTDGISGVCAPDSPQWMWDAFAEEWLSFDVVDGLRMLAAYGTLLTSSALKRPSANPYGSLH